MLITTFFAGIVSLAYFQDTKAGYFLLMVIPLVVRIDHFYRNSSTGMKKRCHEKTRLPPGSKSFSRINAKRIYGAVILCTGASILVGGEPYRPKRLR